MKNRKTKNKLFRLLTAAIFLFTQLNPAWAALTTHSVDADFAGSKLRISDTDTTTAPKLEAYYQESAADPYTVGLWHFDGNTNDSSGKAHTGTLVGNATVSGTTQFMGNVLALDGAGDYVTVPDSEDFNIGSSAAPFSIDAWVRFNNVSSEQSIITHAQNGVGQWSFRYSGSTNTLLFNVVNSWPTNSINFTAPFSPSVGSFYHIMLVRINNDNTATAWRIYINGVSQTLTLTDGAWNGVIPNVSANLEIGGISYAGGYYLNGYLDDFRILKGRALTPEEIKAAASRRPYAVYTSPAIDAGASTTWDTLSWSESGARTGDGETLADSTGLVAQWNFNETSGATATNNAGSCGASCNGTLTNFASTASQDAAPGSGWTNNNKRWGAGALMFDGSNDYVSVADNAVFNFGAGDFTMEAWVNVSDLSANRGIFSHDQDINTQGYYLRILTTGAVQSGISGMTSSAGEIKTGNWYHLVLRRSGSNWNIYKNGISVASVTNSNSLTDYTGVFTIGIEYPVGLQNPFKGSIDSARVYSRALSAAEILSNYNAANIQLQTRTGSSAAPDDGTWEAWKPTTNETQLLAMDSDQSNWKTTSDKFTKLLIHADESNGSTSLTDSSPQNYTITANGNASTTNAQNKFGNSLAIDGSGDWLSLPNSADWNLGGVGGADYTIDFWVYWKSIGDMYFLHIGGGSGWIFTHDGNVFGLYGGGSWGNLISYAPTINTWTHIAIIRSGGTVTLYVGGTSLGTLTDKDMNNNGVGLSVGSSSSGSVFNGYMDEIRISKGIARWTSNFTPSAFAHPNQEGAISRNNETTIKQEGTASTKLTLGQPQADANTVALWHMEETSGSGAYIKDATANANHATPSGTTVVDGIFGKARKFNGTSDYVSVPDSDNWNFGSGDFSIDGWVKWNSDSSMFLVDQWNGSGQDFLYINYNTDVARLVFDAYSGGGMVASYYLTPWRPVVGVWYHIAVVRNGTNFYLFLNGVSQALSAQTAIGLNTMPNMSQVLTIGGRRDGSVSLNGIIDELRILKGRALSTDEIAETYRMGANHRISRAITANDLSTSNILPFYVAADRPGTYLEAVIGESQAANYEADANTVLFLHGDEIPGSTSIKDSSLSGKIVTAVNAKVSGNGKIGNAMYFDGNGDYLSLADSDDWTWSTNYSIDLWVNPTNFTGGADQGIELINHALENPNDFWRLYIGKDGGPLPRKVVLDIYQGTSLALITSSITLAASQWYHVAVVKMSSNYYMYINSQLVGSVTIATTMNNNSGTLRIGDDINGTGPLNGFIDELRIIKGAALSADQIRSIYEYGLRAHSITIDFAAKLDSANLVSGSGDKSFTVDATAYGLAEKAVNLYPGDKIILRENVDGTEYIAQGTVTAVTASSGAVTVASWDSGATFPASGFTANASVFKWQRECFDLSGSLASQRDAITNLTIRPTNGAEGRTIYLDDFRKAGDYLTAPASSTIESTANRYLQYRAIVTTSDPAVSPSLTGVTVNNAPLAASYFAITHNDYAALAGDVETITITAKDINGNVVTGYAPATTVSITKTESGSQAGTASFSKTSLSSADFSNGVATITLSDTEAENIEVIATDDSTTTVTGTSLPVAFSPAAASKIVWTSSAQTLTANTASAAYTVAVRDQYDNLRSADAIVLNLSSSSGSGKFDTASGGAFNGTVTSITTSGGIGTFYYKDTTAGSPTLTVSKTGLTSATQEQTVNFGTVSPTVTSASYKAGEVVNNTIAWTSSALPQNGKVELDFPVGYDLSGTLAIVSGNTNATVSTSGNTLIITLGTAISANSPVSLVVSGIKNPSLLGSTGTYALRTKNASGTQIDQGIASANTIIAPTLTLITPSAANISLTGGNSYDITWNYNGEISNSLKLSYSTDGTNYSNTIATGESNDGAYTWTVPFYPGDQTKVKIEDTFYQKLLETTQAQFQSGTFANAQVAGSGNSASATLTNLFGVSPWTTFTNVPVTVGHGGELIKGDSDTIYALGGNNSGNFLKYTISTQAWESLAPITNGAYDGSIAMVGGVIYAITGGGNTSFWKYSGGVWSSVGTTTPQNTGAGCKLLALGTDLYIIAGGTTNYFWKYNTSTSAWTDLSPLPNTASWGTSMVDGGNGIIYILRGNTSDFWKYDTNASTNPWSTLSGAPIAGALSAEDANTFYAINTNNGAAFWKYIVSTNTWLPLSGISASVNVQYGGALAVVGGNVYAFDNHYDTNFYKYEPAKEGTGWVSLNSSVPFALDNWQSALVKVDNDTLYTLNGANMGKYTISTNAWTTITGAPADGPMVAVGTNTFYALGGNFIRKYTISGTVCTSLDLKPTPSTTSYSAMVAVDSDTIYVTPGKYNGEFWKYSISGNSWQTLTSPWTMGHGCSLAYVNGSVYILGGNNELFWRYIISSGNWESLAQIPSSVYAGKLIAADNDSLYAFSGTDSNEFFKYTISTNKWVGMPTALATVKIGNALAAVDSNTIYAFRGNGTTDFWKYTVSYPSSGSFTSAALDTGGNLEYGKLNWGASVGSGSIANGLLGLWHFNDGGGTQTTTDNSGNSNALTLGSTTGSDTNDPGQISSGKLKGALSFDGTDDYAYKDIVSLSTGSVLSISAWVYPTGYLYDIQGIVTFQPAGGGGFGFGISNSRLCAIAWNGNNSVQSSGATIPLNSWSHVVVVLNGASVTYYINGQATSDTMPYGAPNITNNKLVVGVLNNPTDNQRYFKGYIDEVAVYNRVLAADEVASLYNSGNGQELISASLKFQLSASADGNTWGDFVGPDGTVSTYFIASGTDVPSTGFDTKRYIKYKAYFSTADSSYTPSLNDVSITFTDNNAADSVISDVSDNPFTITVGGALSNTSVVPASTYAGAVGNGTVSFTTAHAIPADGKALITFPAGFTLNSGAATTASSTTLDGTLAVSTSGQVLTLTRSAGTQQSAGGETITLTNIKNPSPGGSSGTFAIQTTTSSGPATGLIDQDLAVAAKHIIGTLTTPAISHASLKAGAASDTTISFTTISAVPVGGKIEVDFPVGYDLSGSLAYVSGNAGTTVSVSGNTLTLTLGAQIAASTAASIVVSGIKSPQLLGSTGAYALRTKDSSGALIDEGAANANTLVAPVLSLLTPSDTAIKLYAGQPYAVTWSYDGGTSNNIKLSYSTNGGSSYLKTIAQSEANDNTYTWTVPYDTGTNMKVKVEETFYQKLLDTSDAQFGGGTLSNVQVFGSGSNANVGLSLISGMYNSSGAFTSRTLDTGGNLGYGALSWGADVPSQIQPENGLVGLWHMDEASGATTIADNQGVYTGTVYGGAVSGAVGKLGNALSFDGVDDYVATIQNLGISGAQARTIELWFKLSDKAADQCLFWFGANENSKRFNLDFINSRNSLYFAGHANDIEGSANTITRNTWNYAAVTYDGTTVKVYINGNSIPDISSDKSLNTTNSPLFIGLLPGEGGYYNGLIDEVAVFNRALSASEIAAHYNAGAGTVLSGIGLKFQLAAKTADSGWVDSDFVGPDGTAFTYFIASGTDIPTSLDTKRYLKYKAYLSTADQFYTPSLNDVSISFSDNTAGDRLISDFSDNTFEITRPEITITAPGNADTDPNFRWIAGRSYEIKWKTRGKTSESWTIEGQWLDDLAGLHTTAILDTQTTIANSSFDGTYYHYSYTWTIPATHTLTNSAYVRITAYGTDVNNAAVTDSADSTPYFKIVAAPQIALVEPVSGAEWFINSANTIKWTMTEPAGDSANKTATLQYAADSPNFVNWVTITAAGVNNENSQNSFSWTIDKAADLPAGAVKLKVFDNAMASTNNTTSWSFKISNPAITIAAPVSGTVWRIGATPEIQWSTTAGVSSEVKIEYFDGTNWNTVMESEGTPNDGVVANDGGFVWTVPNIAPLTTAKIRITDAQAGSVTYYQATIESSNFEIAKPLFTITLPSQSPLRRGGSYTFSWTDDGTMGTNLDVLYAPTGTSFSSIKTQGSFSQDKKSFTWSVPVNTAVPQTTAKFQVKDNSSPFGEGTSAVFSVDKQRLTFDDSTVSGVSWPVGSQHTIGWSTEGEVTGLYIYYYKGTTNIATIDQTANNNALPSGYTTYTSYPKTYSWTIANDDNYLVSGTAKVRISAKTPLDAAVTSTSTVFSVREPYLTVSLPAIVQNSGKWVQGDSIAFNWSADGYLTNNGQLELAYAALSSQSDDLNAATWVPFATVNIAGAAVNSGSFDFRPLDYSIPAGYIALQVRDTNTNRPLSKARSAVFEVSTEPYIGIIAPLSVPAWRGDTDQVIQWQGAGSVSSALKIEYSTDNSIWYLCKDSANVTAENLASIGSFSWRVPAAIKDSTAYIRVVDTQRQVTQMNPTDISAQIKGISLTDYPGKTAGESFTVGGTKTITWGPVVAVSDQAKVKIEYSVDGSHNTWSPVIESEGTANDGIVSDDGSFDWVIPDALSATAKIRVGSVSGGVSAVSDNDFKIVGSLEVSAPAASANWIIGTTQTVSWNALKGTFNNVKLQYSPDNGASWKSMSGVLNAATTTANNGSYSWTLPDDYSGTAKVRVYEENGLSNTAESSLWTIASPQISISQPSSANNGNSALTINEPYDLKWTTTGSTGTNNLKIEISYNNQANWSILEADWPNTSPKSITPTSTSVQAWVKISEKSATHPGAVATAGPFTVLPTPQITLSSPALNSAWTMGKQYEIKWDTQGLVFNTLRISYTLDGSVGSPVWVDIVSGQSNTKSFYWTVSDLTSTLSSQVNAKIRITDDTKGTTGYSDLFTISIPSMSVVRPQGGEVWAVGDAAPVKWSYNGAVIGPLALQYDASGVLSDASPSITASAPKTGQTSGSYTYSWTVPSEAQTSNVKIRVKDSQRPNSSADSPASFEVIAAPTIEVTSPVDGNVFVIQDSMTVNWKVRGLSADSLSIEYWDDADLDNVKDADETLYTLSSGVSRGSSDTSDEYSGKYTGTKTITLPDNAQVSANLKLRVRDPARGYEGLAAGHFRIRGGFELRDETNTANALASSTEWKANTAHTIKWYNKGSFANVKLEYATSSNGTAWGAYQEIISTLANSPAGDNISSYSWTVPDPHLASYPDEPPQFYYVKLKITNLADTSVFTESAAFKIGYYTVTWKVKDYDTLTLLDSLTVSSTYSGTTYWRVNNGALTSTSDARYSAKTYPRRYPYGVFSTFWSKDGYGERSDNDRTVNADMEVTVLLESAASAQTEYKVYAGFAYNEDTDKLKINSWLEKKGTLITSADADVGVGGDGYVKIYDGETLKATLTDSTVDSNGNYWFEASNVVKAISDGGLGLESGKTYFARMGIWYRSREYQSGAAFEVTISKSLKAVTDEIKTMSAGIKTDVASVTSMVSTEAAATRSELKTQLDSGTAAVKEKLASEVSDLKTQTAKILTAAETTIPDKINTDLAAAIKSDVKPHIKSGILNRDNVVKTGQSLTIRYRTETGKSPAISIYNSKNALMVSGTAMTEVSGTGIYEYTATFTASWGTGDFSVVCSESSLGTVDAMVITVIKHTLDEVAGMTSSVMGSTSSLSDFKGMGASLVNIDAQFKALEQSLSGVGQNIISKVSETKGVVSEMESVYNQLANLSSQIKSIGATKNVNLEKLYEVSQEKKEDIVYLKNKAEELKAVMEINKKMTENVAKKPVVQSWFEYR